MLEPSVLEEIKQGQLRVVRTPRINLSIPLFLVHRKDKELSSFQVALVQHIRTMAERGILNQSKNDDL